MDDAANEDQEETERALLDHLLSEAKLYDSSESYCELLGFITRLRNVAPFNAMILQIQKPGVTYVASAYDWWHRFQRRPKEDARPLLILWPFAPVATVYDILDTDGKDLPEDAEMFPASGDMTEKRISGFVEKLNKKKIQVNFADQGDSKAGQVQRFNEMEKTPDGKEKMTSKYRVKINQNHKPANQFTTLAHELGHLFLGHLGKDADRTIPERRPLSHQEEELEAESVAYIVCERNDVHAKSEKYLSDFVENEAHIMDLDFYQIMRASNQVETVLGLGNNTKFPTKNDRKTSKQPIQPSLFD